MARAFLSENWLPKSVLCLRDYNRHKFLLDVIAGVTVGLVALPLAMAFAIASGLTPQAGIYCAIVTGFLISALGGSKTQIGGPTGAFVVVVAGIVAVHGVDGLFMCTVMAGVLLVIMGLTGLGTAVKFIPRPVVIGFTNGIAVLIASTQVKDFFGLHLDKVPGVFWLRMEALAANFHTLSFEATALAGFTLLILIACRGISARIPGPIVALLLATCAVYFFRLPLETIGTKFGGIPAGLPHLQIPKFRTDLIHGLLGPAFTVAMLGAIESLMSAVVSDRMSNDRHNPNVELVGQGVANIVSPMFGGLPATGAIARTATSIRSGAQSPVAGVIHALTLLCILLFAAPLVSYVPMAALAAILMIVAYNMGEWREIPQLLKMTKTDISIWLVTFADRICRSHRRRRSRDDPGGAAVHQPRGLDDDGFAGDRRLCGRRARAHPAGQGHPLLRDDLSHPRAISVRSDRQDCCGDREPPQTPAGCHFATPKYDGARRHRIVCHRGSG